MSAEVESMFSVVEVPWHGLGRVLKVPPKTPEEAIILAGQNWNVEKYPEFVRIGDKEVPTGLYSVVRSSDHRVLGRGMTKGYTLVQNNEAFRWFQPFMDEGLVTLESAGSLRGGRRVWVLARINAEPVEIVKDDAVVRYILLSNSHDGSLAVRAGFTTTRVVCANTLAASHNSEASKLLRIRHTKNVLAALEDVQDIMKVANAEFEASVEQMRAMARKGVDIEDVKKYVRKVFEPEVSMAKTLGDAESKAKAQKQGDRLVARIIPLFEKGRGNDMDGVRGTMWAAYNAVTEYLSHERGRTDDRRVDSLWFGDSSRVGEKAFKLAMAA